MATPVQPPTVEVSPPPEPSNPIDITNSPIQSAPPPATPLASSPPEPSPSPPPPTEAPPPTSITPPPPPPPDTSPPPPPQPQPDPPPILPPPPPPETSPPPPPESSPQPPPFDPPPSVPPPQHSPPPQDPKRPTPPPPQPPEHPPPPPQRDPKRPSPPPPPPLQSPERPPPPPQSPERPPPPSRDPKRPAPPPPQYPEPPPPSPQDPKRPSLPPGEPVHSSPPPPPPDKNISLAPNPSPVNLPSISPPSALSPPSPPRPTSNSRPDTEFILGISLAVVLVLFTIIGVFVCCLKRRKRRLSSIRGGGFVTPSPSDISLRSDSAMFIARSSAPLVGSRSSNWTYSSDPGGFGQSRELFSYEELDKATNGFSEDNLLGEGGFGRVYKGELPDGRVVAVKQLKLGGGQGDREFKAEVETISRVHHRHLLSLVGYCISEDRRLLIYDYISNNNLYYHLHASGTPGLDWPTRVKIAAGAARGLAYLHEDCHPRIIHRDIKSSNILLEDNFHALVCDFGLAKLALDCYTHITTRVMGTFGYLAPEYASSGKLTEKSDVFSFGVVLLELITGRKPVDSSQPLGDESLVEWARPLLSHAIETEEVKDLADPKLGGKYVDAELFRMIEAAAACIRHSAAKRPRMSQIVRAFDSLAEEDLTNGMKLGQSEIINSAQQSEEIRWFRRMAFGSKNFSTDFFSSNIRNSTDENV